jgi:hypothetical protein
MSWWPFRCKRKPIVVEIHFGADGQPRWITCPGAVDLVTHFCVDAEPWNPFRCGEANKPPAPPPSSPPPPPPPEITLEAKPRCDHEGSIELTTQEDAAKGIERILCLRCGAVLARRRP